MREEQARALFEALAARAVERAGEISVKDRPAWHIELSVSAARGHSPVWHCSVSSMSIVGEELAEILGIAAEHGLEASLAFSGTGGISFHERPGPQP